VAPIKEYCHIEPTKPIKKIEKAIICVFNFSILLDFNEK